MAPHWTENHLLDLPKPTVLLEVSCGENEGFKVRNLVEDGSCPTCIKEQVVCLVPPLTVNIRYVVTFGID